MILLIDNYDSFVFNLARYTTELGYESVVVRNDQISIEEIEALRPSHIILSPGPCAPDKAGICVSLIQQLYTKLPILGVCLGHQAIGAAFGGQIVQTKTPLHGKGRLITHDSQGLFRDILNPMLVARYHSLVIEKATCPSVLHITATCPETQDIMAVAHEQYPVYGVQFHPESVLTKQGKTLLGHFLEI